MAVVYGRAVALSAASAAVVATSVTWAPPCQDVCIIVMKAAVVGDKSSSKIM